MSDRFRKNGANVVRGESTSGQIFLTVSGEQKYFICHNYQDITKVLSDDMTRRRHHNLSADEINASELTLILGGSKLLYGLGKSHGFEGVIQLKGLRVDDSRSWDYVRDETVLFNFNFFLKHQLSTDQLVIHDIIFDSVNMEERARPSSSDNIVKGYARESNFHGISLSATSYAQLFAMKNAEKDGNLKPGGEAEIFGIVPNHCENYNMRMITGSGTHKKGSSHWDIGKIILVILRVYDTSGSNKRDPITGLWSDGAVINNLPCFQMCTEFEVDKGSRFFFFVWGRWCRTHAIL